MHNDSLRERIIYKKKYAGEIEREGKIYRKYVKQKRFVFLDKHTLIVSLIIIILAGLYFFFSRLTTSRR